MTPGTWPRRRATSTCRWPWPSPSSFWCTTTRSRHAAGRGYFKHYAEPYAALTPINIIEEITKPITLTFRLFGNIFSGVLMVAVIVTLIPPYLSWIGLLIWKPFDELFIGAIQAYIFGLLTIIYLGMGMSRDQH